MDNEDNIQPTQVEKAERANIIALHDSCIHYTDETLRLILNLPFRPEQLEFFIAPPPAFPPLEIYDRGLDPREKENPALRPGEAARHRALGHMKQGLNPFGGQSYSTFASPSWAINFSSSSRISLFRARMASISARVR